MNPLVSVQEILRLFLNKVDVKFKEKVIDKGTVFLYNHELTITDKKH